jgi:hypothetical protein
MIQSLPFRKLYDQLSTHPGEPEDASQSHAERFDLVFKAFSRFGRSGLQPIDA